MTFLTERYLDREYTSLTPPKGLYVMPVNAQTWSGVLFVHSGPYAQGVFRFNVVFPADYPSYPPDVFFSPQLFHPLIDMSTGRCVYVPFFPGWDTTRRGRPLDTNDILTLDRRPESVNAVLQFIAAAFSPHILDSLSLDTSANREAFTMLRNNASLFSELAAQSAKKSHSDAALFNEESMMLPLNPSVPSSSDATDVPYISFKR